MSQKKYEIIINGLKESISQVDVLANEIETLEKKIDKLSNEKVKIGIDKSLVQQSKEIEKNLELSNEEVLKNIQNTEKLKAQNKEILKQNKEIALGIREQSGEYANTLAGQRAYLAELKASLANMELDTSEWDEMRDKVGQVNERVKDLEKSYGVFSRDVGHYENATKGLDQIEKKADDVASALQQFRESAKFDVEIDGVAVQFDDVGQAISEIDKQAQKAAASLMAMKEAGQENTEEYERMQAAFESYATKSGELQRAVKYTDQLKDSVASTTYELDVAIRAFQEIGAVLQGATAIAGMFGKNQEEIQKAMNATVQVMSIMQAAQTLINSTQQKGSLIVKAYQASLAGANMMMKAFGVATTSTSLAVKGLRAALVSTGIGALVVLLGVAVNALMKFFDKMKNGDQETRKQIKSLDELNEKYELITKTLNDTSDLQLANGLITSLDAANNKLDVAKSKAIAYRVELLKLTKFGKDMGKTLSKYAFDILQNVDLNDVNSVINAIDTLEQEYIALAAKANEAAEAGDAQAKVWDAQAKAAYETINALKDLAGSYSNVKKEQDNYNKKVKEANEQLKKIQVENIKDEYTRKKKQAELNFQKELQDIKERGIKVAELEKALREQLNKELLEIDKEYQEKKNALIKKSQEALNESESKVYDAAYELASSTYGKKIDYLNETLSGAINKILSDKNIKNLSGNLAEIEKEFQDFSHKMDKEVYSQLKIEEDTHWLRGSQEALKSLAENYKTTIKEMVEANKELEGDDTFQTYSKQFEYVFDNLGKVDIATAINSKGLEDMFKSLDKYIVVLEKTSNDAYTPLINAYKAYINEYDALRIQWENQQIESTVQFNNRMEDLTKTRNESLIQLYTNMYEGLESAMTASISASTGDQFMDSFGGLFQFGDMKKSVDKDLKGFIDSIGNQIINLTGIRGKLETESVSISNQIHRLKDEIGKLAEGELRQKTEERNQLALLGLDTTQIDQEIAQVTNKVQGMIREIASLFVKGQNVENNIIDVDNTIKGLKQVEKQAEETGKNITKEFKDKVVNAAMEIVNAFNQMYSMVADMNYANEMDRIDREQDLLDEELDMLQDQLDAKEEMIQKYNDRINSIEGELETARGDRRLFLLDQINQEVAAREREYAEKQRLMKQEQENAKKQEQLKKDADAADAKRRKAQKVVDVNMSIANTALAVIKSMSAYVWPYNMVVAGIVGALGAAQTAIISATKYADGGLLQGPSHAQGGIKVLGGTAEVEGNEFITNKATTMKNLDLLEFINSKKKKIDLYDLIDFYSGNNKTKHTYSNFKFANGGQLPSTQPNQDIDVRKVTTYHEQDNRPIYVSVQEIENVQRRVKNVRVLAGQNE